MSGWSGSSPTGLSCSAGGGVRDRVRPGASPGSAQPDLDHAGVSAGGVYAEQHEPVGQESTRGALDHDVVRASSSAASRSWSTVTRGVVSSGRQPPGGGSSRLTGRALRRCAPPPRCPSAASRAAYGLLRRRPASPAPTRSSPSSRRPRPGCGPVATTIRSSVASAGSGLSPGSAAARCRRSSRRGRRRAPRPARARPRAPAPRRRRPATPRPRTPCRSATSVADSDASNPSTRQVSG